MTSKLLSIGKSAAILGVSIDTLRRWDNAGRIRSVRSGPAGHRYYRRSDIELFLQDEAALARQWVESPKGIIPSTAAQYCQTRDVFQARLESLQSNLSRHFPVGITSLITAICGEIGNNSFDHNLGNWPDVPGVYFSQSLKDRKVVVADRGQGIWTTLKRVRPTLKTPSEALKMAFTEIVSGREPEARGNGLKFVREVVIHNPLILKFQTGDAMLLLKQEDTDVIVEHAGSSIQGCLAIIEFEKST
jgi:hypothetical protein